MTTGIFWKFDKVTNFYESLFGIPELGSIN